PGGQIWRAAAEATGSGRSARRGSRRWAGRRPTGLVKAGVRPGRDGPGRRAAGSSCRRRRPARGSATGEEQRWPELVELEEPGRARGRSSWIKQSGGDGDPALPRGRAAAGDGGDAALPLAVVLPPFGSKPPASRCPPSVPLNPSGAANGCPGPPRIVVVAAQLHQSHRRRIALRPNHHGRRRHRAAAT
ncbi:unnamed protein product, partial [Urochloa humidicola]